MNLRMSWRTACGRAAVPLGGVAVFALLAAGFFLANGYAPLDIFAQIAQGAFGSALSINTTLSKTLPILLCALATALPARMGLISVGAEGQLYFGALAGTAAVLQLASASRPELLPAALLLTLVGGAAWGALPGLLRAWLGVNETIVTILMNYLGIQLVEYFVYGPWKDAANLGWPATIAFPEAARLPRLAAGPLSSNWGLLLALLLALVLHLLARRSRWGAALALLRSNPRVARMGGLSHARHAVGVMALAGAMAGLAGYVQTANVQHHLQPDISSGYGYVGFLVAWLAGQDFLRIVPLAVVMGGLLSAADALQLFAQLPFANTVVLQALLFISVLGVGAWRARRAGLRGEPA
ncbi:MAG: ABC transporter permease [Betaproteobacteria bacterium]|nr:ABC transporter permease [Betaproteobacteria bacterium]